MGSASAPAQQQMSRSCCDRVHKRSKEKGSLHTCLYVLFCCFCCYESCDCCLETTCCCCP